MGATPENKAERVEDSCSLHVNNEIAPKRNVFINLKCLKLLEF